MYIGIYDQDLFENKAFRPNLETMQISTMCKNNNHIVELILDLTKTEKYDKIYLVKNNMSDKYIGQLMCDSKVIPIGMGFNNGNYPGYEFDTYNPDILIYNRYFNSKHIKINKTNMERHKKMLHASHGRLKYADRINKKITYQPNQMMYLYDTDLEGLDPSVLSNSRARFIHFIRDIKFDDFDELIKWRNQDWNVRDNNFIYNKLLTKEQFRTYINKQAMAGKPVTFIMRDYVEPSLNKIELETWLDRHFYAYCRQKTFRLIKYTKNRYPFYQSILFAMLKWHNQRMYHKSFADFYGKTNKDLVETLCERNYNINMLMHIVPKDFVQRGGMWNGC